MKKDGVKMNRKKPNIMCNKIAKKQRRNGLMMDGEQLEEGGECKYLGRLLTPESNLS